MGVLQSQGSLANEVGGLVDRKGSLPLDHLAQIAARGEFHDEVMPVALLACVVGEDDIGVPELGDEHRLAVEAIDGDLAGDAVRMDKLDSADGLEDAVPGLEYLAHAALAKLIEQDVGAKRKLTA